jgi:Icc-related predicted phosphoesterase
MAANPVEPVSSGAVISRRESLARLGTLLAAGLWPGALRAAASPAPDVGTFTFAALNDLHYHTPECEAWFRALFGAVAAERPAFMALLGDLVHRGQPENLAAVRRLAGESGVPFHAVPGNHDNDVEETTRLYAEVFPGMLNHRFEHAGWQFVALDSTEGKAWRNTRFSAETLAWLDAALAEMDPRRPTVLLTHFPVAPGIATPTGVVMTPLNAEEVLSRFEPFNLRAAFCGHFHGRTERTRGAATLVTGSTCARVDKNHNGVDEKGWWLCRARSDGTIEREFRPLPV